MKSKSLTVVIVTALILSLTITSFLPSSFEGSTELTSTESSYELVKTLNQDDSVTATAISNDGSMIAVAWSIGFDSSADSEIKVYDSNTFNQLFNKTYNLYINDLHFSSNDSYLFWGNDANVDPSYGLKVLETDSWTEVFSSLENTKINGVSSSSNYLSVGAGDNNVYLFNISDNDPNNWVETKDSPLTEFHNNPVKCVAFSNDGSLLSSGSFDKVQIFNTSDFSNIQTDQLNTDSLVFSPDDKYLGIGGHGIYSTEDWSLESSNLAGGKYVSWDDGSYVHCFENKIYITETSNWSIIQTIDDARDDILSTSADNDLMVAGSKDNNFYVYESTKTTKLPSEMIDYYAPFGEDINQSREIKIEFNDTMNKSSVEQSFSFNTSQNTYDISNGTAQWPTDKIFNFKPNFNYESETKYTVKLSDQTQNITGTYLESDFTWSFTTKDTKPLEVIDVTPTGDNVSIDSKIIIEFDDDADKSSVQNAFSYEGPYDDYDITDGTYSWTDDKTFVFNPDENFYYSNQYEDMTYNVTLDDSAKDTAGNSMKSDYSWEFTTEKEDLGPIEYILKWLMRLLPFILISIVVVVVSGWMINKFGGENSTEK